MKWSSPPFRMDSLRRTLIVAGLTLLVSACGQASVSPTEQVTIQGSDTEVQLVSSLVEAFTAAHPGTVMSVAGGGSAVGIAALINGETDIANSSRQMKPEETASAKVKGRDPREFILARDGLSIVVHPSNAVAALSMEQIGRIFRGEATNWKDVGGGDAPIVLYGRQSTSGTFGFFRDTAVKGDYAPTLRQMEGSEAIVNAVKADRHGVGYVGVGYVKGADGEAKPDIKTVPVSREPNGTAYSPLDRDAVEREDYPIARRIYQYVPRSPSKGSLLESFLRFEASPDGQAIVEQAGFYSVIAVDETANDAFFAEIR